MKLDHSIKASLREVYSNANGRNSLETHAITRTVRTRQAHCFSDACTC